MAFEGSKSSSSSKAQGGNAAAGAAKPIVVDDDPTQFDVALLAIIGTMLPNAGPAAAQGLEAIKTLLLAKGAKTQGKSSEPDKPKSPQQEHTELMKYHDQVQSKLRRLEKKQGDKDLLRDKKEREFLTAQQEATDNMTGIHEARSELLLIMQRREAQFPNGVLTMPQIVTRDAYEDMDVEDSQPIDIKYAGQYQMGGGTELQGNSASNGAPDAVAVPHSSSHRDSLPAGFSVPRGTNLLSASGYDRGGAHMDVPGAARAQQIADFKLDRFRGGGNGKGSGKLCAPRYEPFGNKEVKAHNADTIAATQAKAANLVAKQEEFEAAKAANELQIADQEAADLAGVQFVDDLRADAVDKAQSAIDESGAGGRPPEADRPPIEA